MVKSHFSTFYEIDQQKLILTNIQNLNNLMQKIN